MRFPEFSGEWEKCKVSDILDLYPTNSLSWEQLEYKYEGLYNLHYGLIHNCSSICINTRKIKLPTIKENNIPNNYTSCKNGDVAFADASEDTNDVARCIEFINCNNDNVVCGLHTVHGRDNSEKTIVGFKGYAFSAQSFRHQIRRLAQGTKIYSINSKNFSECYIGIPSKEEQTKVSNLLYIIDERIQTQKKIIDKYESLIKGIIDSAILNKHQNVIIQKVCKVSEQTKVEPDINKILTVRLHCNGVYKSNAENLQLGATQYYHRTAGQLIYGKQNFHNGAISIIPDNLDGGITSKDIPSFDIDYTQCNPIYLLSQLQSPKYYKKAEALTTGTGSKRLKEETFLKMGIVLPPLSEQNNIAKIISRVTKNIDYNKKLLQLFCQQKQYLFHQMFI